MRDYAKIGGVLSIVSGGFGILVGIIVGAMIGLFGFLILETPEFSNAPDGFMAMMGVIYGLMALFYVVIGILGIVGGAYAVKKKKWGLALAAAIAGTITFYVGGIIALIFIVMAKDEFEKTSIPVTATQSTSPPII